MRALITVSGIQGIAGDDTDTIELVTEGYYTRSENGFEMYYLESELTGLAGTATSPTVSPSSAAERSTPAWYSYPDKKAAFYMIPGLARLHSRSKPRR